MSDPIAKEQIEAAQPVESIETDHPGRGPADGVALCLSGGGYRAMLFHTGTLWRLNEAGVLPTLARISSVSGGSIAAGVLAMNWDRLELGHGQPKVSATFVPLFVEPVRALARRTLDVRSVLGGILWFGSISNKVVKAYRKHLFGDKTLQDLPDAPQFIFNATNVQSGALWRFAKAYMADWKVGKVKRPVVSLAEAVAASSAFPPVLSPMRLRLKHEQFAAGTGKYLQRPPFTTDVYLTDGGVYDNLGLETAWKAYRTVLVSDAGAKMEHEPDPKTNWASHSYRVLALIDNQVRALRKRQLIGSYKTNMRDGAYWGIASDIAHYELDDALPAPFDKTQQLANVPTRLRKTDDQTQQRLINWGYAVCDAAIRRHWHVADLPSGYPYPQTGV